MAVEEALQRRVVSRGRQLLISGPVITPALILIAGALFVAAGGGCGGGGHSHQALPAGPLVIKSNTMSLGRVGDHVRHIIPIEGGCGGPYICRLDDGRVPHGLEVLDDWPSIEGTPVEAGEFEFRLTVTDVGCAPFVSTTGTFTMTVLEQYGR